MRHPRALWYGVWISAIVLAGASCAPESGEVEAKKGAISKSVPTPQEVGLAKGSLLQPGSAMEGSLERSDPRLDDGSHYDIWPFQAQQGDRITIEMVSEEFDSYLLVGLQRPQGPEQVAEDDDSGGGLNASVTFRAPATGEYVVLANSAVSDGLGAYRLTLTTTPSVAVHYGGTGDPADKYALLVAVSDYPEDIPDLPGTLEDVDLMASILVDRFGFKPENVVRLLDDVVTRESIVRGFREHLSKAGPDGVAVFFFSGHGTQLDGNYGLLAPIDDESDGVDEALLAYDGLLIDDELGYLTESLRTENAVVVIDACNSGTVTRGGPTDSYVAKEVRFRDLAGIIELPSEFLVSSSSTIATAKGGATLIEQIQPERHVVMTACASDEVSFTFGGWADRDAPASVFTYHLAKVLGEAPAEATFMEAIAAVRERCSSMTGLLPGTQTPQLEGRRKVEPIQGMLGSKR